VQLEMFTLSAPLRADDSHTYRHLIEFWMIEPKIILVYLRDVIKRDENSVKYCLRKSLTKTPIMSISLTADRKKSSKLY